MEPTTSIKIADLSLGFANQPLLKAFTTDILQGEFIGIFGPNGAGKSTLLRAILGLLKPLSGEISVLGFAPGKDNSGIGYMPQTRHHFNSYQLSGRAVISAALQGLDWGLPWIDKAHKAELEQVIELVEAQSFIDKPFNQLSGGQQQRLLFAQALFKRPKILLLDEPLTNLDPYNQDLLIRLIQRVQHEFNATVLFTAHDVNPLLQVMNRVLYIARGNAAIGKAKEVITSEQLSTLYQAPMEVIQHADRLFVFSQESGEFEHGSH